jgi:23S rRNA (guanosine2251-2'-O)-methyltransferase
MPKDRSLAIVLGNEGEGIRPLVKQNCDMIVKIPMFGKVNSLNVSVAAALMMYQAIS